MKTKKFSIRIFFLEMLGILLAIVYAAFIGNRIAESATSLIENPVMKLLVSVLIGLLVGCIIGFFMKRLWKKLW